MFQKESNTTREEISVIVFEVDWEQFAIDLSEVKEILQAGQIRRLPKSMDFIEGIYNYRGEIIQIINLKKKLRLNEYALYQSRFSKKDDEVGSHRKFIIILNINNASLGLLVDRIINIAHLEFKDISALSPIFQTSVGVIYIKSILKFKDRPRILLDMRRIHSEVEKLSIQQESIN